jgi:phosphohistidine swiveling domain-containing protein
VQESRRNFAKKTALVAAGAAAVAGTSVLAATGKSSIQGDENNGVIVGSSTKKEILYKKTATWDEYYKTAK